MYERTPLQDNSASYLFDDTPLRRNAIRYRSITSVMASDQTNYTQEYSIKEVDCSTVCVFCAGVDVVVRIERDICVLSSKTKTIY